MLPGEDGVDSSAGQGKLVLDEDLDVAQARRDEVIRQHWQRRMPGAYLTVRRAAASCREHAPHHLLDGAVRLEERAKAGD